MQRGRASAGGNIQVNRGGGRGGFDRGRHGGGHGGFREDRGRRGHEVSTPSVPSTATTSQVTRSGAAHRRESDRNFARELFLGVPASYRQPYFLNPRKDPFAGALLQWDPEWGDPEWVVPRGFDNDELSASASAPQTGCAVAKADAADASALRGRGQVPVSDNAPQRGSKASASASQIGRVIADAEAAGISALRERGQAPVSDTSTETDVTRADLLCSGSSGNSAIGSHHMQQEPF